VAETTEQAPPKPRDFRQEVTDNIIAMLEKGVAPWQKPWDAQSQLAMPTNPTTDRAYRGGNAIHLLAVGMQRSYDDPRWMTYKQASERGWQVRRGERGTQIEFWDVKTQPSEAKQPGQSPEVPKTTEQAKNGESGQRLIHRVYTVFNARQIEGIPALNPAAREPFGVAEAGERILKNSGAKISHDQADRAFYDRRRDAIHLPPKEAFKDAPGYYGTALHELGHWTGHPSRLDRWTLNDNYRFGDTNYAKEELRAELASVFIAAEKGIPHDPQNHAAYVGSWIQVLKQDENEIFRAAHDASKAVDLLLSLERDVSIADQDLETATPEPGTTIADASRLERDRELLEEQPAGQIENEDRAEEPKSDPLKPSDKVVAQEPITTRESTQTAARHENQNGAVSVTEKQTGTERRTQVEKQPVEVKGVQSRQSSADRYSEQFQEATSLAAQLVGDSAKVKPAQLIAGVHRGKIIGETSDLVLQRESPRSVVFHSKDLFDAVPKVGSNVVVNYKHGTPSIRGVKERGRSVGMSR
jgi:antirestriction protein ArdC